MLRSCLKWVKVALKMVLEKYIDLHCPACLGSWSQELGGEWEGRKIRTECCLSPELMKEVSCRAIYWVLSLEHV